MRFHGGINTADYLDFSVNVPDRRLSADARAYIDRALDELHLYPSIDSRELCDRLGGVLGVGALLGNGATQLIYASARLFAGKKVLIVEPTFTEYAEALRHSEIYRVNILDTAPAESRSAEGEGVVCDEDRAVERIVSAVRAKGIEAVYICNPCNPVGIYYPNIVSKLISGFSAAEFGGSRLQPEAPVIVVDESFIDFVDDMDMRRHQTELNGLLNLRGARVIVIRSLTKAFSVPGLRLGYAFGTAAHIDRLAAGLEPWSVGTVSAAFMRYILDFDKIFDSQVSDYAIARGRLELSLKKLGFCVYPSKVNFLLFKAPAGLNDYLREHSLNIRTCSDFVFLSAEYYRTTVRREEDNQRLIKTLSLKYGENSIFQN